MFPAKCGTAKTSNTILENSIEIMKLTESVQDWTSLRNISMHVYEGPSLLCAQPCQALFDSYLS